MEWAIESVLKRCLNGRELVIWGTGPNAFAFSGTIGRYSPISCYISKDADKNPEFMRKPVYNKDYITGASRKPYVVVLADSCYTEIRDELNNSGYKLYGDYYDWIS